MASNDTLRHCRVAVANAGNRPDWVLYASVAPPVRLVVFVHGFNGKTVGAWTRFDASGAVNPWWHESDLLFVGYDSLRERPGETAAWLRQRLSQYYPVLPDELLTLDGIRVRPKSDLGYQELIVVGHSLGGFILRLMLLQASRIWLLEERIIQPDAPRPRLLDAQMRLFSPASAGFDPAGMLGMLAAAGCLWGLINVVLHRAPAYTSLIRGTSLLAHTQTETEQLVRDYGQEVSALRARIMWARPENVVERSGYGSDHEPDSLEPERNHSQVCKPNRDYPHPWRFVETGKP